jgi:uroporphyrinogen decarboxylase
MMVSVMNRRERVVRAIEFREPDRVPIWMFNRDVELGDVMLYDLRLNTGDGGPDYHGGTQSEWGYEWKRLDDGTMGQPTEPVIRDWSDLDRYRFPEVNRERRLAGLEAYRRKSEGYYRLPVLIITGFTTYTFLRGFENAMVDFVLEREHAERLLDGIFKFEKELMTLAAEAGFDGFHFGDDWGSQHGLMISPELWREIFKPRYRDQFEHAHKLGLHVWFHSCGNPAAILGDFHEIGVDVMNLAQPNVVDVEAVSRTLRGRQCFMMPISYQTISISGTPAEILAEGRRLQDLCGTREGGLIGYVEEYGCMGMCEANYQACIQAFRQPERPANP